MSYQIKMPLENGDQKNEHIFLVDNSSQTKICLPEDCSCCLVTKEKMKHLWSKSFCEGFEMS